MSAAASGDGDQPRASYKKRLHRRANVVAAALSLLALTFLAPPAHSYTTEQLAWIQADKGRSAFLRGDYLHAESLLTEALRFTALSDEGMVMAFETRGLARWRLRELVEAVGDFNKAISIAPDDPALYNNRGNVLLELGQAEEAAKDFGQAIALSPYYGAAYSNRANARYVMGKKQDALADFTAAIKLMPDNAVPFNGRGLCQLALRRPAGAMRDFSRAIALNSNYAQALTNRAEALIALNRYADAVRDYSAAIGLGARSARVFAARGSAYASLDKPRLALADFKRAAALDASISTEALLGRPVPSSPASLAEPPRTASSSCGGPAHAADLETAILHRVGEASEQISPSSLVYRSDGSLGAPSGLDRPESLAAGPPCNALSKFRSNPDEAAPELAGWTVAENGKGDFVATLVQRKPVYLTLEMYGAGTPQLLHWQLLEGTMRGIGLLHYFAGTSDTNERLEYVAIIDILGGHVVSIEPAQFGLARASWTWRDGGLLVVDPEGVPSNLQLRARPTIEGPAHVRHLKRAKRRLPPRFARRGRWSPSHLAGARAWPHHRSNYGYSGYPGRYGLK